MIPNNIHFIFFGFTDFVMMHYLAVKSAIRVHKPDRIFLYYSRQPKNNPLWNEISELVELVQVTPPEEFKGIPLTSYQYKADITRLEILIQQGGIYLDIDVLSIRPFGNLLNNSCVLGIESADDPDIADISIARSITNAVIMCEPQHPFMIDWLEKTADNLANKPWAYHAVCLPLEMLKSGKYDNIRIEPRKSFMPFDFRDDYIFKNDGSNLKKLKDSYTMHMWETIWKEKLIEINNDYLGSQDNLFTYFYRDYKI
jgi:hypothetical protein